MNIESRYAQELQHIKTFFKVPINAKLSAAALFKDYFASLQQWRKEFRESESTEFIIKRREGHNIFMWAAPELIENFIPYEKFENDIKDYPSTYRIKSFTPYLIYLYIHWEIFKDHPDIKKYEGVLPPPYESAIIATKRGAELLTLEARFNVSGPLELRTSQEKYYTYTLPSKEEDFLDFIDERCGSNPMNIPTQKDLDLLFEEFNIGKRNLYQKHRPEYS